MLGQLKRGLQSLQQDAALSTDNFGTPMQLAGTHANAVRGQADATLQHTSIAIAGVQTGMDLAKG